MLGACQTSYEGRRYNEKKRFINRSFSNYYLPTYIITIYSFDINEKHLTRLN